MYYQYGGKVVFIDLHIHEKNFSKLISETDVCVTSIEDGLDLLLLPKRLIATLRG